MKTTIFNPENLNTSNTASPWWAAQKTSANKLVGFNELKHGILSRNTVLGHESLADYESLVNSLIDEHKPAGATEQVLVEELASVIWRKRRVLLAEGAAINQGVKNSLSRAKSVILAAAPFEMGMSGERHNIMLMKDRTPQDVAELLRDAEDELENTFVTMSILEEGGDRAYKRALLTLKPCTRSIWESYLDKKKYSACAIDLNDFLQKHVLLNCSNNEKLLRHHSEIMNQTIGEGLQPTRLEKFLPYETHLDSKFERTLDQLLKIKVLRTSKTA